MADGEASGGSFEGRFPLLELLGRHGVSALDLPCATLAELSRGGSVYGGIERDVEVAFISARAQALWMTRWTAATGGGEPASTR